jgi:hypothetical protein
MGFCAVTVRFRLVELGLIAAPESVTTWDRAQPAVARRDHELRAFAR